MATRTITLTGRPPVSINEDDWPVIAKATDSDHDGEVECQANRKSLWSIRVRQHHIDGRVIVYATYGYQSNYRGERCYSAKRGVLMDNANYPDERGDDQICQVIVEVCADIAQAEHGGEDASRWPTLAAECIADMPAESI